MSSITEDEDDGPLVNYDTSKGSSVSSGMQEEYNELLKYAIVTPKWEPQVSSQQQPSLPQLRLNEPDHIPLTTVDEYTESTVTGRSTDMDGHDSAMGSDEITSDRKTFRDPPSDYRDFPSENVVPVLTSTSGNGKMSEQSFDVDSDFARMNKQLNQWNSKFNNMVLAEFSQAKIGISEHYRKLLHTQQQEHQSQMNKLQDEMENMKELLHTYEKSLARKDSVISNLTRAVQTSKERQEMGRALAMWKLRLNDEKRQSFTAHLAKRHREHVVAVRAWQAWRSIVEGRWKEKVEKACQKKAQEVCVKLTDDYEAKMASLDEALESSRVEVQRLHTERDKYEENMKKAFMRGVCALNLEAMSMFHDGDEETGGLQARTLSAAVDALGCASQPQENAINENARIPPAQPSLRQLTHSAAPSGNVTSQLAHAAAQPIRDVTPSARVDFQMPRNVEPAKMRKKPKSSYLNVKVTTPGRGKVKVPTSEPDASRHVLVRRHHPNIQNEVTRLPLKHVVKYPNTPNRPIKSLD